MTFPLSFCRCPASTESNDALCILTAYNIPLPLPTVLGSGTGIRARDRCPLNHGMTKRPKNAVVRRRQACPGIAF
jgi:hypothetical protein